jgi:hypothetical protein
VVDRITARGIALDDPTFRQVVGHWITDDITLSDVVILWSDVRSKRHAKMSGARILIAPPKTSISESRTELLAHIAFVSEVWPRHSEAELFIG